MVESRFDRRKSESALSGCQWGDGGGLQSGGWRTNTIQYNDNNVIKMGFLSSSVPVYSSICYESVCKQIRTWKLAVFRWLRKKCLLNGIMSCLFADRTDTRWQWQLEEELICSHFHMFSLGMRMKAGSRCSASPVQGRTQRMGHFPGWATETIEISVIAAIEISDKCTLCEQKYEFLIIIIMYMLQCCAVHGMTWHGMRKEALNRW